jgi:hypothetical protein
VWADGRRSLQQWEEWWKGIPTELRAKLIDTSINQQIKIESIMSFLHDLGLRAPSEPTLQSMTAIFLIVIDAPADMPGLIKHQHLKTMKRSFEKMKEMQKMEPSKWLMTWSDVENLPAGSPGSIHDRDMVGPKGYSRNLETINTL